MHLARMETAALEQLQELARTGDKRAQYALGLMYADGVGTSRDLPLAYGWLSVAAETDQEEVIAARAAVSEALTAEQRPAAEKQAEQLIDQYGRAAIRAQGKTRCERYSTIGSHMVKKRCYRGERERERNLESGSFSSVGAAMGAPLVKPGIPGSN